MKHLIWLAHKSLPFLLWWALLFKTYIHYLIHALPSSLFSMHNFKNHQKIPLKREGKQTVFCKQTRPAVLKSPILQSKNLEDVLRSTSVFDVWI